MPKSIIVENIRRCERISDIRKLNYTNTVLFQAYLKILIEYLWHDEYQHYIANKGEHGGLHTFQIISELRKMCNYVSVDDEIKVPS